MNNFETARIAVDRQTLHRQEVFDDDELVFMLPNEDGLGEASADNETPRLETAEPGDFVAYSIESDGMLKPMWAEVSVHTYDVCIMHVCVPLVPHARTNLPTTHNPQPTTHNPLQPNRCMPLQSTAK